MQKTETLDSKPRNIARSHTPFIVKPQRTMQWLGGVNYQNLEKTLERVKILIGEDSHAEIQLLVNSYGGATGIAMSFFDAMKWLKVNLVTIGSGDVDSSGVLVFLAGKKRFLTRNTTMLLHLAGRTFEECKRYTTTEMSAMLKEDKLKDYQYACVVADGTGNKYSPERILELMAQNTILTAEEALNMGLAHGILK